jgi:hypothetical protein
MLEGEEVEGAADEGGVAGAKSGGAASKSKNAASTRRGDRMDAKRGGSHDQFLVNAEPPEKGKPRFRGTHLCPMI